MHFTLQDILHLVLHGMLFFEKWSRYCVIVRFKVESDLTELFKIQCTMYIYCMENTIAKLLSIHLYISTEKLGLQRR